MGPASLRGIEGGLDFLFGHHTACSALTPAPAAAGGEAPASLPERPSPTVTPSSAVAAAVAMHERHRSDAPLGGSADADVFARAVRRWPLLPKLTASRETGGFRKLSGPCSASHEPCQTPNDVYDTLVTLRAAKVISAQNGEFSAISWDGRSSQSVHSRGTGVHARTSASTRLKRTDTSRTHRRHGAARTGQLLRLSRTQTPATSFSSAARGACANHMCGVTRFTSHLDRWSRTRARASRRRAALAEL
jgi:hypothetical protein